MPIHYFSSAFRFVICVLGAGLIGITYYVLTKPMAVRIALPLRAVVTMREFYQDSAPLPDFIHCIRTEVTEPEFKLFVAKMKLVPYQGVQAFPSCEAGWWSASADSSMAFYDPAGGEETGRMAKFENGKLYYLASD
jgi:hypothetical protein